jgi:hypothetical protein
VTARRAAWIVLALVLAGAALSAEPAAACSCVIGDPRTMLAEADGAFVGTVLAVRDLQTFRIVREQTYRPLGQGRVTAIVCRNATGSDVAIFETTEGPTPAARVVVGSRTVWTGNGFAAAFTTEGAYVSAGTKLLRVDLRTGKATPLATIPASTGALSIAPDRRIAGVAPSRIVVFDSAVRPNVRTALLSGPDITGTVAWSGARLVFLPNWDRAAARVYDSRLRLVGWFAFWRAGASVVAGGRAFGVGGRLLLTAPLPRGPVRVLRELPTPLTEALASVR